MSEHAAIKKTCAVLGASTSRSKFGNKSVRAHLAAGYTVYPVNPRADVVEGLTCYATLAEIPENRLTRVSVYLPAKLGLESLPEIAAKGCQELWLNPGAESQELIAQAKALGLNVITGCSIVDVGYSPGEFDDD